MFSLSVYSSIKRNSGRCDNLKIDFLMLKILNMSFFNTFKTKWLEFKNDTSLMTQFVQIFTAPRCIKSEDIKRFHYISDKVAPELDALLPFRY